MSNSFTLEDISRTAKASLCGFYDISCLNCKVAIILSIKQTLVYTHIWDYSRDSPTSYIKSTIFFLSSTKFSSFSKISWLWWLNFSDFSHWRRLFQYSLMEISLEVITIVFQMPTKSYPFNDNRTEQSKQEE